MPTNDPFDINKPVSPNLDLGDFGDLGDPGNESFPAPVTIDEPAVGLTDDELLAYSNDNALTDEIYPEREAFQSAAPTFSDTQNSQKPLKVNLGKKKKDAQMPAVRAEMISVSSTALEQPQKVNLEKPEKAAQMPAVRADSSQPPVIPWKSGEQNEAANAALNASRGRGKNEVGSANAANFINAGVPPEKRKLGSGTVNFALSGKKNVIMLIVAGIAVMFMAGYILFTVSLLFDRERSDLFEPAMYIGMFGLILVGLVVNLVRGGEHWHYEATGREIIFSRSGRTSYIIFYKDVLAVEYQPYKFLGLIDSGYTVTVLVYGTRYEFKYVYPNLARKIPFDYTPFEIIRTQINQLGVNN